MKQKKLGVAAADLDTHPLLITFENGTLDLETMTLGPHKREHLITKMIQHNYNPEAKLPRFFSGCLNTQLAKEAMPYMQKLLGYSLTGETSEKTFIVVWGAGDTGKTTFLKIVRKLLEEYAMLLQVDTLMDRQEAILLARRSRRFAWHTNCYNVGIGPRKKIVHRRDQENRSRARVNHRLSEVRKENHFH